MTTIPLIAKPGVQQDGTQLNSPWYLSAQHTRFKQGVPRKIGGYATIDPGIDLITRDPFVVPRSNNTFDFYLGRSSGLEVINVNRNGYVNYRFDVTPEGFVPNDNITWQFQLMNNADGSFIISVPLQTLHDIASTIECIIYFGDINVYPLVPLIPITDTPKTTSGGIVVLGPYLVKYGTGGLIQWSSANDFTDWPEGNYNYVSGTKLVAGQPTRAGGEVAGLIWSQNELMRIAYDPTLEVPTFVGIIVNSDISILSARSIVTFGEATFWLGTRQFFRYTGVVEPIPNIMNSDYFFNSINRDVAQKAFAWVNYQYYEIWFHWPKGDAEENTDVIIYDILNDAWFDTYLPRAGGVGAQFYPYPILTDSITVRNGAKRSELDPTFVYPVWMHEQLDYNRTQFNLKYAIESYFETPLQFLAQNSPNDDLTIVALRIEPDFVQDGIMSCQLTKRAYPNSEPVYSDIFLFDKNTQKIELNEMARLISVKFSSNTLDGFYQCGQPQLVFNPGAARPSPITYDDVPVTGSIPRTPFGLMGGTITSTSLTLSWDY